LDETAEPLAGNAGANDAADHVQLLAEAVDALPVDHQAGHQPGDDAGEVRYPMLVRASTSRRTRSPSRPSGGGNRRRAMTSSFPAAPRSLQPAAVPR
jgi:hypothetical protein